MTDDDGYFTDLTPDERLRQLMRERGAKTKGARR
jgi:hypothetical protein